MTLRSRQHDAFAKALHSQEPTLNLRSVAGELLKGGMPRRVVLRELEEFRYEVRQSSRPADEDVVLDVMDFVEGWASPHIRL